MQARQFPLHPLPPHCPYIGDSMVGDRTLSPTAVMNLRKSTRFLVLGHLVAAIHQRHRCCIEKGLGKRHRWNREIHNDFTEHQKGN
jgi:hypothetical protein